MKLNEITLVSDEENYKQNINDSENKFLLTLEGEQNPLQSFINEHVEPISYKILKPLKP